MTENAKAAESHAGAQDGGGDEGKSSLENIEITMDKRLDLVVTVGFILFGVFMIIEARKIDMGTYLDPITPQGLPYLTGAFLVLVGILQAVRQLSTWRELPGHLVLEEGQEDEKGYPSSIVRASLVIILSMLWELLLPPLGFLITTPIYLAACSVVMGVQSWKMIIGYSIILTILLWYGFGPLMGVRLPLGPLEDAVRYLGFII